MFNNSGLRTPSPTDSAGASSANPGPGPLNANDSRPPSSGEILADLLDRNRRSNAPSPTKSFAEHLERQAAERAYRSPVASDSPDVVIVEFQPSSPQSPSHLWGQATQQTGASDVRPSVEVQMSTSMESAMPLPPLPPSEAEEKSQTKNENGDDDDDDDVSEGNQEVRKWLTDVPDPRKYLSFRCCKNHVDNITFKQGVLKPNQRHHSFSCLYRRFCPYRRCVCRLHH